MKYNIHSSYFYNGDNTLFEYIFYERYYENNEYCHFSLLFN